MSEGARHCAPQEKNVYATLETVVSVRTAETQQKQTERQADECQPRHMHPLPHHFLRVLFYISMMNEK
jgi:hypothetical protein